MYKLGLIKSKPDKRDLLFENYFDKAALPTIPNQFGHDALVSDWQMLGNDRYGCCVWSGGAHETMLWNKEAGKEIVFTPENVLSDYASTGFNPATGANDNGTQPRDAMKYRVSKGLIDSSGNRHKIAAYVRIKAKNLDNVYAAMYLFGAVGIGIKFPSSAMEQFNNGQPWDVVNGSPIEGGHYVPIVAKRDNLIAVTWGKEQPMTNSFFLKYCTEVWGILSEEMLVDGCNLEGFNNEQLLSDLKLVKS